MKNSFDFKYMVNVHVSEGNRNIRCEDEEKAGSHFVCE